MSDRITWRRVEELHRAIEDVDPKKLMASGVSAIVVDGDESADASLIDLSVAPQSRRMAITWAPVAVARALSQFTKAYDDFEQPFAAGDTHISQWFAMDSLAIAIDALRPIVEAQAEDHEQET